MKEDVFNQYVERVIHLFNITKEEFFSKSKKRNLVDARQLVYYLCSQRPIQITYVQKYMRENGYDVVHSVIIHGIRAMETRAKEDKDYQSIIKELDRAVFI
jgi:chromosomal replication initiation ATPase DnaA